MTLGCRRPFPISKPRTAGDRPSFSRGNAERDTHIITSQETQAIPTRSIPHGSSPRPQRAPQSTRFTRCSHTARPPRCLALLVNSETLSPRSLPTGLCGSPARGTQEPGLPGVGTTGGEGIACADRLSHTWHWEDCPRSPSTELGGLCSLHCWSVRYSQLLRVAWSAISSPGLSVPRCTHPLTHMHTLSAMLCPAYSYSSVVCARTNMPISPLTPSTNVD